MMKYGFVLLKTCLKCCDSEGRIFITNST